MLTGMTGSRDARTREDTSAHHGGGYRPTVTDGIADGIPSAMPQAWQARTPAGYRMVAAVVSALRAGAASAAVRRGERDTADRYQAGWEAGYALGWSSARTLAELTAADVAGAAIAEDGTLPY